MGQQREMETDFPSRLKGKKMLILKDIFGFLMERKKFWLIPIIFALLLIGLLIVMAGSSAIAPFIYTIF
jgi:hypothetical protein